MSEKNKDQKRSEDLIFIAFIVGFFAGLLFTLSIQ